MRYIVSVRSNIKSDHTWEVQLDRRTIIKGQTFSGKSSIVEAITLALRGHGDDVVFGKPKTAQGLLALIGQGQDSLFSEVTFDDGSKATYAFKVKGEGSFSKPAHTLPGWAQGAAGFLPLHDIQARITGDPSRAMDAFLEAAGITLPAAKAKEGVIKALSKNAKQAFDALFGGDQPIGAEPTDGVKWLVWLRELAKRKKLDADADARKAEATVSTPAAAFNETITEAELATAKADLAWHEAGIPTLLWDLGQAWAQVEAFQNTEQDALPASDEEAEELSEEDAALADQAAEVFAEIKDIEAYLGAAQAINTRYNYQLPYAVGEVGAWKTYLGELQAWAAEAEPRLKYAPAATEEATEAMTPREEVMETYSALYAKVEAALLPFELTVETVDMPNEEPEAVNLAEMRLDVARKELLFKQQEGKSGAKLEAKAAGKTHRGSAQEYKEIADATEVVLAAMVEANKVALEERVSKYLPKTDRCVIQTSAHGVDGLFMPYIVHSRKPAPDLGGPAFSGYEGNLLLMALAGATIKEDAPFACLIPPDRDRGSDIHDLLQTWRTSPFQVIITTNSAHVPSREGWTVLEVTRGLLQG